MEKSKILIFVNFCNITIKYFFIKPNVPILATHLKSHPIPSHPSPAQPIPSHPKSHPKSHLNPIVVEGQKYYHSNRLIETSRMVVFPFIYAHWTLRYLTFHQ